MTPNLNEATSLVNSIPLVKESIPTLMKLANGSNPSIPSYMALGRLQQIKAMIEHSQQPQMPKGTVKQNLERSVATMGMMNGRQQQMQQNMTQQGIAAPGPVPEGVPQPAPMPQPEQMPQQPQELMAAHGGILHTRTDPDMFNFAPGGIVAFAKEGEVKDKDKLKERQPDESFEQFRQRQIRAQADAQLQKDLALQDQTEQERLAELAKRKEAGQIPKSVYTTPQDVGSARKKTLSQEEMRAAAANTANSSGISTLLQGGREPIGIASASPAAPAPPPPPAPRPAAAPRPVAAAPAAPAAPAAAPAAAPVTQQGVGALNTNTDSRVADLLAKLTPDNKYIKEIDTAQAAAKPEAYDQQKAIADQLALNESLGIGTYGKNRREQMEKRAKEFEGNRMSKLDRLILLGTAFSRPGARAGDMGQRSVELNEAEREARERFQTAQDALMNTVELADEAIRTGNASEILKTKAAKDKALQDWKAASVKAKETQAQAEAVRQQTGTQAATSVFGDEMRLQAERERTASAEKVAAANNVSAQKVADIYAAASRAGANKPSEVKEFTEQYFAIVKSQGQAAADAWLAQQEKVRGAYNSGRFQDKAVENELKIQVELDKQTAILQGQRDRAKNPADRAAFQTKIDDVEKKIRADVKKAAGNVPPPGAVTEIKKP
jgi:hypothetical protein